MSESLRVLPEGVGRSVSKKAVLAVELALVAAVAVGCSPDQKVQYGQDVNVGNLPADMCMIDGRPDILTVSTQSNGDMFMAYVNTKGQVIAQTYTNTLNVNIGGFKEGGKYIWQGASCPSSR